jgi:holo-[acyl-carrier protein] synthase
MVLGIGIDFCDVQRMRRQLDAPDAGFVASVFLPAEIAYCQAKHRPEEHFAARFAAKEAVVKALAAAGGEGAFWHDVEVIRTPDGAPAVVLHGRLRDLAAAAGVGRVHVSLTHTGTMAAAMAVADDSPTGTHGRTR